MWWVTTRSYARSLGVRIDPNPKVWSSVCVPVDLNQSRESGARVSTGNLLAPEAAQERQRIRPQAKTRQMEDEGRS